jgi:DNA-binding NarL/FixJ family response regulator
MRVVIAEDSGFFRNALVQSLESSGFEVVAAVGTAEEAVSAVETLECDVAVLDICLPPTKTDEGLQIARHLGTSRPHVGVLVLSAYLAMPHVASLLDGRRTGVGCLSKDQLHDADVLLDAVTRVAGGGIFVDPEFVGERFVSDRFDAALSSREVDMLRSVAEGLSNQAIANRHFVALKTVERTLTSVFRKLEINTTESNARVSAVLAYLGKSQSFRRKHADGQ